MNTEIKGRKCWWCLQESLEVEEVLGVGWSLSVSCRICQNLVAAARFDYPGNVPWRRARESNLDEMLL